MRPMIAVIASISVLFPVICAAQSGKTLPTNDEIELVLTQTERAMAQYKPLIDQEEAQLGPNGKDAVEKDRGVMSTLELAVKAFRRHPEAFNSPLGFSFFEWLDDASRNALLCATSASLEAAGKITEGNASEAGSLVNTAQACSSISTLIYTVSENAGALYQRYLEIEAAQTEKGSKGKGN